jgi:hypothetical protein
LGVVGGEVGMGLIESEGELVGVVLLRGVVTSGFSCLTRELPLLLPPCCCSCLTVVVVVEVLVGVVGDVVEEVVEEEEKEEGGEEEEERRAGEGGASLFTLAEGGAALEGKLGSCCLLLVLGV